MKKFQIYFINLKIFKKSPTSSSSISISLTLILVPKYSLSNFSPHDFFFYLLSWKYLTFWQTLRPFCFSDFYLGQKLRPRPVLFVICNKIIPHLLFGELFWLLLLLTFLNYTRVLNFLYLFIFIFAITIFHVQVFIDCGWSYHADMTKI